MFLLTRVVSGGQTGVDQAALRAAQAFGLECGGWCPPGRDCDDGVIPACFTLQETPQECSAAAPNVPGSQRPEWNVRDSDGTLVLRPNTLAVGDPGTDWCERCARSLLRPLLVCNPFDANAVEQVTGWLSRTPIRTLNVAGPSERSSPGIGEAV